MIDHPLILYAALPAAAYLIGSIPFGVLIARSRGVDLRGRGSGNVGATNVGRVMGARWGYLCFVLDVLKGFVPVFVVGRLLAGGAGRPEPAVQAAWLATALGCILGHVFSLYLRFRGGKGVATSLGVLLGVYPYYTWPGLAALGLWVAAVLIWRYVSLASILAAAAFPVLFAAMRWPVGDLWPLLVFAAVIGALVVIRHRSNIRRLLAGSENRVGLGRRSGEKPDRRE
jgi:glycerol-3-phosphate acyltransferase PlsY